MTGFERRVAPAALGVLCLLASTIIRFRANPPSTDLLYTDPAVTVAVWLLSLLLVVVAAVRSRTGRLLISNVAASRGRRVAVLAVLLGYAATLIPGDVTSWFTTTQLALSSSGAILLIWALLPVFSGRRLDALRRVSSWLVRDLKPPSFLLLTAGFTFVSTNLASWLIFRHIPHVQDSINQVFQGRVFASGHITLPVRFDDYFFGFVQVFNDGQRAFSVQPFGHSLLLALGTLVHSEWLVNPLLGSAQIVVLYLLGKEVYDEATGRIAALLGVASPFLLFMSSEYMNHASSLLFLSLFLLFYFRTIRSDRQGRGEPHRFDPLLSGLCLAMALNIRPLTALAVSAPVAIHGAVLIFRTRGRLLRSFLLMALPVVLGLGAFAVYNYLTTGSATASGYEAYGILQYHHPGFGVGFGHRGYPWWPGPHTPVRGIIQTAGNLVALNRYLFEGPLPGLMLVLLLFLTLPRNPADYLLLATSAALPVAYSLYFFQDLCFGPRFLYEGLAPLLLLSARGLVEFPRFADKVGPPASRGRASQVLLVAGFVSLAFTAVVGLPSLVRVYASSYWGVDSRVRDWTRHDRIRNAVVFVNSIPPPPWPGWCDYYGSGFLLNALDFSGPVVCARDRGDLNYLLMRQFPGRSYYRATTDTFYRIANPESLRFTPTIEALAQAGAFVAKLDRSGRRGILLPFREAGALVDTTGLRCHTYRSVDYVLFRDRSALAKCAPSFGVFLTDDENKYSPVFEPMRRGRDFVAGDCRFVLLFRTEDGKCAVYDIRPTVSGEREATGHDRTPCRHPITAPPCARCLPGRRV